jgi:hypothetical protein
MYSAVRMIIAIILLKLVVCIPTQVHENATLPLQTYKKINGSDTKILWCIMGVPRHQPITVDYGTILRSITP